MFGTPPVRGMAAGMRPALPAPIAGWPAVAWRDPGARPETGPKTGPETEMAAPLSETARARILREALWRPVPPHDARHDAPASRDEAPDLESLGPILWICPWRGRPMPEAEGLEALSFLAAAARANDRPAHLIGMSRWKRRCVAPFLAGPHGPPAREKAAHPDSRAIYWGDHTRIEGASGDAFGVEDGFLRSVGLGLRHVPPVSLIFNRSAQYFDATRRNGFEDAVAEADFAPALLARAARLRARILELGLSKYNLSAPPPDLPDVPEGREAVLVVGQVETDASIRLGSPTVRRNLDLLAAAREAHPGAVIAYKPHPDVLTGLREGGDEARETARYADCVLGAASPEACLDWADRVVVITSLMGFEALMRGKHVTALGRPFYSGWGLTEDRDPPARDRTLTLDQLTAAALILYPRYIHAPTNLPAPPEIAIEALANERNAPNTIKRRARNAYRNAISRAMNWL